MKKIYFSLLIVATSLSAMAQQPAVATFEELCDTQDIYWDGSDLTACFTSGGYTFINNYVDWGGYGSWDGFAYSSMTSNVYSSLADQYNCCVGAGVNGSTTFGVAYYSAYMGTEPTIIATNNEAFQATGCYVTNSAYAYTSMLEGDDYSKKFDETDWFLLTATGYLAGNTTGNCEIYLAKDGEIMCDWNYFDLSSLGTVDQIHFTLSSSDTGQWGMNTPAYFCIDDFGADNEVVNLNTLANASQTISGIDLMGRQNIQKGFVVRGGKIDFLK